MARYSGNVRSITPSTSDDNWTLDAPTAKSGRVLEVSWGGEATTTTAMQTRVTRCNTGAGQHPVGAGTLVASVALHPNSPSAGIMIYSTYATQQPTLVSGDLFSTSWNAHGGVVRWLAAPGEEFVIIGVATICCRNSVGTATSSYGVIWEED